MDRIEAAAEEARLRTFRVERNAEREYPAGPNEVCGLDNFRRAHVVERADLVVLAPAAPIGQFLRGLLDCLKADTDIHANSSEILAAFTLENFYPSPSYATQRLQHDAGCCRHFGNDFRAQRAQRVVDRVHHDGRRTGGARLARALGAELG